MNQAAKKNKIELILGRKGYGKSTLVKGKIRKLSRLIVFDYLHEYEGDTYITTPQDFLNLMRSKPRSFRVCYRPSPAMDVQDHFNFFSKICFEIENYTLVLEEVDLVSAAGRMPEGLKKIINYGRHRRINVYALSRRAHMVPRDISANADAITSFCQQEPRDIKYLSEYMGEKAEQVRDLQLTEIGSEFLSWENNELRRGGVNFIDRSIYYS